MGYLEFSWDDLNNKRKKKTNGNEPDLSWAYKLAQETAENRINRLNAGNQELASIATDYDKLIDYYNAGIKSVGVDNAKDWNTDIQARTQSLYDRMNGIRNQLSLSGTKEQQDAFNEILSNAEEMRKASKETESYYGRWATQADYEKEKNDYIRASMDIGREQQRAAAEKAQYNSLKNADLTEIDRRIKALQDEIAATDTSYSFGDFIKGANAPMKTGKTGGIGLLGTSYQNDAEKKVAALQQELDDLRKQREAAYYIQKGQQEPERMRSVSEIDAEIKSVQDRLSQISHGDFGDWALSALEFVSPSFAKFDAEYDAIEAKDLKARLAKLETERSRAITKESLQSDNFGYNSRYTPSKYAGYTGTNADDPNVYGDMQENDLLYDYINDNVSQHTKNLFTLRNGSFEHAKNSMTSEERMTFNYLWNNQGKDAAIRYLYGLEAEFNRRDTEKFEQETAEATTASPWGYILGNVASVLEAPAAALEGFKSISQKALSATGEIDQNDLDSFKYTRERSAIRAATSSEIAKNGDFAEKWGVFGYQTAMSMADFLFQMVLGQQIGAAVGDMFGGAITPIASIADKGEKAVYGINQSTGMLTAAEGAQFKVAENLSLAIMGGDAMSSTLLEKLDSGVSQNQAFALAVVAGFAEIITEKVSLENLLDEASLGKDRLMYLLQNIACEGSEEIASDIINYVADLLIMTDKAEIFSVVEEFEAQGYSHKEAVWRAISHFAEQTGMSGFGGALSGGTMAAGSIALDYARNSYAGRYLTKGMDDDQIRSLAQAAVDKNLARENGIDGAVRSDEGIVNAQRLQKQIDSGDISTEQLGRTYRYSSGATQRDILAKSASTVTPDKLYGKLNSYSSIAGRKLTQREKAENRKAADTMYSNYNKTGELHSIGTATVAGEIPGLKTGDGVIVLGIDSTDNGTVQIEVARSTSAADKDNSVVVNLSELSIDDAQVKALIDAASDLDTETAKNFYANYYRGNRTISVSDYKQAYMAVLGQAKKAGATASFSDVVEAANRLTHLDVTSVLSSSTLSEVYAIGTNAGAPVDATVSATQKFGVIDRTTERTKNGKSAFMQNPDVQILDEVARAHGKTIYAKDSITEDENGGHITVLSRENGNINAAYDPSTDTYSIAANGSGKAYLVFAIHESGHEIKAKSPEAFGRLLEIVRRVQGENLQDLRRHEARLKLSGQHTNEEIDSMLESDEALRDAVDEEIVCNTLPAMLKDDASRTKLVNGILGEDQKTQNKIIDFFKKVRKTVAEYINRIKKSSRSYSAMNAAMLQENADDLDKLIDEYTKAYNSIKGSPAAAGATKMSRQENIGQGSLFADVEDNNLFSGQQISLFENVFSDDLKNGKIAVQNAEKLGNNNVAQVAPVKFSRKYAPQIAEISERAAVNNNHLGFAVTAIKEANALVKELSDYMEENYVGKTDKNGNPLLPEEVKFTNNVFNNDSYIKGAEPTTECYRQTIYRAFAKKVTDKLGRPLTSREAIIVNQMAIEIGREAPCIYCYSLLDTKQKEEFKLNYYNERQAFFERVFSDYGSVEAFSKARAKDKAGVDNKYYQLYLSREADPSAYDENGKYQASKARSETAGAQAKIDAGELSEKKARVEMWLDLFEKHYGKNDGGLITLSDISDPQKIADRENEIIKRLGAKKAKLDPRYREIHDLERYAQSSAKAKKRIDYSAYANFKPAVSKSGKLTVKTDKSSILNWSQDLIDRLNSHYGLRWYCHADFHAAFVIDNMQQIIDASIRGLKGLMYIKPIEAAKIFAPTGMNLNCSCFAQYVNGEYICDNKLGADWDEVKALRDKYKNVGSVMVVTNDDMMLWALSQDWVDVVIPLHLVYGGDAFVKEFGLTNYSGQQADKLTNKQKYDLYVQMMCEKNGTAAYDANGNPTDAYKQFAKNNKSVEPPEHQNNYDLYTNALNVRGATARFNNVREAVISEEGLSWRGTKITTDMYMKLVNESRQAERDTMPLHPKFDKAEALNALDQLPEKGYFDYFKPSAEIKGQTMDVDQCADQVVKDIEAGTKANELGYGRDLAVNENGTVIMPANSREAKKQGVGGAHDMAAQAFLKENGDNIEYSRSGNVYAKGRKPSSLAYDTGLERFFHKGETRLGYNYATDSFFTETWDGSKFVKEESASRTSIYTGTVYSRKDIADEVDNYIEKKRARMGSFFSGGGTLEHALRGIVRSQFAVEYDEKIAAVFTDNHGIHAYGNVFDFDVDAIEGILDYFHASPVCKRYSIARKGESEADNPLDMASANKVAEVITKKKAKVITIENVPEYQDSDAVKIIESALNAAGYTWDKNVYNSGDYGAYTARERMIIRAVMDGELPPMPAKIDIQTSWYDCLKNDLPNLERSDLPPTWRDKAKKTKLNIDRPGEWLLLLGTAKGGQLVYSHQNELAKTITASYNQSRIIAPDGTVYRCRAEQLAKLQGLDGYKLPRTKGGRIKEDRSVTIVGNGIPVQLTQAVVEPLLDKNIINPTMREAIEESKSATRYSRNDTDTTFYDIYAEEDLEQRRALKAKNDALLKTVQELMKELARTMDFGYTKASVTEPLRQIFKDWNIDEATLGKYAEEMRRTAEYYGSRIAAGDMDAMTDLQRSLENLATDMLKDVVNTASAEQLALDEELVRDLKGMLSSKIKAPQDVLESIGAKTAAEANAILRSLGIKANLVTKDYGDATLWDDFVNHTLRPFLFENNLVDGTTFVNQEGQLMELRYAVDYLRIAKERKENVSRGFDPASVGMTQEEAVSSVAADLLNICISGEQQVAKERRAERMSDAVTEARQQERDKAQARVDRIKSDMAKRIAKMESDIAEYKSYLHRESQRQVEHYRQVMWDWHELEIAKVEDKISALKEEAKTIRESAAKIKDKNRRSGRMFEAKKIDADVKQLMMIRDALKKNAGKNAKSGSVDIKQAREIELRIANAVAEAERTAAQEQKLADEMYYGGIIEKQRRESEAKLAAEKQKTADAEETARWDVAEQRRADDLYYGRKLREMAERYRGIIAERAAKEKARQARAKTIGQIEARVKTLEKMLRRPTDAKHIPEIALPTVQEFVRLFTDKTGVFDREKLKNLDRYYKDIDSDNARATDIDDSIQALKEMFDQDTGDLIYDAAETLAGKRITQLNDEELAMLKDITNSIYYMARHADDIRIAGRAESRAAYGEAWINEAREHGPRKNGFAQQAFDFLGLQNELPIYFFRNMGGTARELFDEIDEGVRRYTFLAEKIHDDQQALQERYNRDKWAHKIDKKTGKEETITIATSRGDIQLTRMEALALWATYKREIVTGGKTDHVLGGGIVLDNEARKFKDASLSTLSHHIEEDVMTKIDGWLTEEQKAYADAVVRYMSNDMSKLGNEVTMQLYGVKKFKEKYYFPFSVSRSHLPQDPAKVGTQQVQMMRRAGFQKDTIRGASNPIVIRSFDDIAAGHMQQMAMYSTMLIPLDNMNRVMNYKGADGDTVHGSVAAAYGKASEEYINRFMRDLNGNITKDPAEKALDKLVSKFKRNAVLLNLSVAIQQPSAIIRAMAIVNPKYFVAKTAGEGASYEELKKYSYTAILKEVGGFDMGHGLSHAQWISGDNFNESRLGRISDKINEIGGWLPDKMDEITWGRIWAAVKAETAAKHPELAGEALLTAAGRRFDEVINLTQVYDSTMSRSANMRSKSTALNMVTAFMAEPTVSLNLLIDSVMQVNNGGKKTAGYAARNVAAFAGSVLLNSLLQSVIGAARDDDDEKTYLEKYLQKLLENFVEGINPLNLLPLVKDAVSIFGGYDVIRSDTQVGKDIIDAFNKVTGKNTDPYDRIKAAATAIGTFTGVPVRNVIRDMESMFNIFANSVPMSEENESGIRNALADALANSFPFSRWIKTDAKTLGKKAVIAYADGDKREAERIIRDYEFRLKRQYPNDPEKAQKKAASWMKQAIQANYSTLGTDVATRLLRDLAGMTDAKEIYKATEKWEWDAEDHSEEESFSVYGNLFTAVRSGSASEFKAVYDEMVANGYTDEQIRKQVREKIGEWYKGTADDGSVRISKDDAMRMLSKYGGVTEESARKTVNEWTCYVTYGIEYSKADDYFKSGEKTPQGMVIDSARMKKILMQCGGKSEDDAIKRVRQLEYEKQYPELSEMFTSDQIGTFADKYENYGKPAGISIDVFADWYDYQSNTHADVDASGKSVSGSRQDKLVSYINSLPLTRAQKDALFLTVYAESSLKNAPWH